MQQSDAFYPQHARGKEAPHFVTIHIMNPLDPAAACRGYELLASGNAQRLERWQGVHVLRPETESPWPWAFPEDLPVWDGMYRGDRATGGVWTWRAPLPDPCIISWEDLNFLVKPTASKHLGLFPEQAPNWLWIRDRIRERSGPHQRDGTAPNVLNLFGYTGAATLAASAAGARVTHVDAARAMVNWCSGNARLSGLGEAPIRYIVEDALTFLLREIRRGMRYDAVIMDPPAFGRGKGGQLWKLSEHLPYLLATAQEVLTEDPLFILLSTYGNSLDDLAENMINKCLLRLGGSCERIELNLTGCLDQQILPCGLSHRWKPA